MTNINQTQSDIAQMLKGFEPAQKLQSDLQDLVKNEVDSYQSIRRTLRLLSMGALDSEGLTAKDLDTTEIARAYNFIDELLMRLENHLPVI